MHDHHEDEAVLVLDARLGVGLAEVGEAEEEADDLGARGYIKGGAEGRSPRKRRLTTDCAKMIQVAKGSRKVFLNWRQKSHTNCLKYEAL